MTSNHNGGNAGKNNNDVQYFDSDFSFEEHAAECAAQWETPSEAGDNESIPISAHLTEEENDDDDDDDDNNDLLPQSQSKVWDAFHSHHSASNFYKPRRYLTKSFPCILQYFEHGNSSTDDGDGDGDGDGGDRILLEIGCGSGSSCIPIIKRCSEMECAGVPGDEGDNKEQKNVLLACDSSPVAVETTRRFIDKMMEKDDVVAKSRDLSFGVFVADPSLCAGESDNVPFLQEVKSAYEQLTSKGLDGPDDVDRGIVGIVLMVFVLSAVTPSRVDRFLEQVYRTTKTGGKVCFRDYGLYDMSMLRFPAAARKSSARSENPVFVRGEGTIARFFSVEATKESFESAGFSTVELRYCTVFNHNRKTGQKLKRVFVHGVFEKPNVL